MTSFIVEETPSEEVVTPEDFTGEQHMVADTVQAFVENEVLPHEETLEKLDYRLTAKLMRRAGALGLLGADVPERYGGIGLDKISSTLISEKMAAAGSFALSMGAHAGIGTLPIVFFGNEKLKQTYLPALASGEKIASYCLTEPHSGSDALGAKTTARLSADGKHYILNGSKMYITNGGFADIYVVYAKIDGTDFSAFIVERGMKGFSTGPEEKKMGIKGSSTVPLYFENVHVPVENLLGERGKGHLIAFNTLNIGRFKLAAGALGTCKEAIALSAAYANARHQFGKPISSFPLIGKKLADMNIRTYALESILYRTAGLMDLRLKTVDDHGPDAGLRYAKSIAEYAVECSINKVFATEALDFVADEGVQIHGGAGFIQEYKIERIYRDSRINRIFEGTNEINRLLIPGMLLKKALKGEVSLLEKAEQFQNEMLSDLRPARFDNALDQETYLVRIMKNIFLFVVGDAIQKYGLKLEEEQEALASLADIMIAIFAAESVLLRTKKRMAAEKNKSEAEHAMAMTRVFIHETFEIVELMAKRLLSAMAEGDALRAQLTVLKKFSTQEPVNTTALKRDIAARVTQGEKYTG